MAKRGLKKLELSTDLVWSTATGTWNEISLDDLLKDSFSLGEPEKVTTEMASGVSDLDAIMQAGAFRAKRGAANLPVSNTRGHLRATPHVGTSEIYGGEDGALFHVYDVPVKAIKDGKTYVQVDFEYIGEDSAAILKDG